jgi:hypothetical protein
MLHRKLRDFASSLPRWKAFSSRLVVKQWNWSLRRRLLASVIGEMHQDLSELRGNMKKLEKLLRKERAASRQLEARLRCVLLEGKIKEHRQRAMSYILQLNLILTMSNRQVFRLKSAQLEILGTNFCGSKLDALWRHAGFMDAARLDTAPNLALAASSTSIQNPIRKRRQFTSYYSSPLGIVWTSYERISHSGALPPALTAVLFNPCAAVMS